MPKKPIFLPLAALFETLNKITGQTGSRIPTRANNQAQPDRQAIHTELSPSQPAQTAEFQRIADALERIAAALESLTSDKAGIQADIIQSDSVQWITLPDTGRNSPAQTLPLEEIAKPQLLQPEETPKPQPASLVGNQPSNTIVNPVKIPPAVNVPELAVPPVVSTGKSVLDKYLKERGIEPKERARPQDQAYQDKLDQLALYLGQNFEDCQALYQKLKKQMIAPRKAFDHSLKGATATQNNRVQKFCRFLKEAELLEEYTYQPKPDYHFILKSTGKEQKYLSGAWLENYVKQEVARLAQPFALKSGQPYEARPNLEISFKDTSKAELDLLFSVGQRVFCVEAKTRSSLKIIQTTLNRIEGLGLDKRAILIVVSDKSAEECLKLSQVLGNVRIACLPDLEKTVNAWLEAVL